MIEHELCFSVEPRRNEDGTNKPDGLYLTVFDRYHLPEDPPGEPAEILQKAFDFLRHLEKGQNVSDQRIVAALGENNLQVTRLILTVLQAHPFELEKESKGVHWHSEQYGNCIEYVFCD